MTKIIIKSLITFEVFAEIDCTDPSKMTVEQFACAFFDQISLRHRLSVKTTPISSKYMLRDHIIPSDFVFICEGIRFDASERYGSYRKNQRLSHYIPANQQTCRVYVYLAVYGKRNYCLNHNIQIAKLNHQDFTPQEKVTNEISLFKPDLNNNSSRTFLTSPIPDHSVHYNYVVNKLFWQNKEKNSRQSDKINHKQDIQHLPTPTKPQAMSFWKQMESVKKRETTTSPHTTDLINPDLSSVKTFWHTKDEVDARSKLVKK